ncbi:MAG TPA: thermonuclease family protein [Allosphingosinicella sp.]|nr:thermonuclease family protein [Allosphingosinicella sp.]
MSKHWNPRFIPGGRPRPRRPGLAQIVFMVAAGLFLGTAYVMVTESPIPWPLGLGAEPGSPALVEVIDGDTFDYRNIRIRIADIDTPEVRGQCAYERELAARATTRMRTLLVAGPFELRRTGTRDEDRYGRKLRIVTRGGESLGRILVAEGLAREWTGRREPWC